MGQAGKSPTKPPRLKRVASAQSYNLHQRMASRGSCQPQTDSSVIERTEGTNHPGPPGSPGRRTAEEASSPGPDQCGEFLLCQADAGQDSDGVRSPRWRDA